MTLLNFLACPNCLAALSQRGAELACSKCNEQFPVVGGMPWLTPAAAATLWEWRGRMRLLIQQLDASITHLSASASRPGTKALTAKRHEQLIAAKKAHRQELEALMAPLGVPQAGNVDLSRALKVKVPAAQSLMSYYANLHRDWAWSTNENEQAMAALAAVIPAGRPLGSVLVLGAGAGRLSYDLHRTYKPDITVAVDINPLMLLTAKRLVAGEKIELHEFPLAPLDLSNQAVRRTLAAPHGAVSGLEFVFADALQPPFKPESFDTVLTPWLIDIIPAELGRMARTVNRLLKPGGVWLNTGSLAFNHADPAWNYSYDETLSVVQASGFAAPDVKRERLPYMQSPASAHGRVELVTSFAAVKAASIPAEPPYHYLPDWLINAQVTIPRLKTFDAFAAMHGVLLEAVALIDGKRTLADIAKVFGGKHGLTPADAEQSLRGFLIRHYEDTRTGSMY